MRLLPFLISIYLMSISTASKGIDKDSEFEKDTIRKIFSDWQVKEITAHHFWAKDSCNGSYFEKYGFDRLKKEDNGWGFPDSSEIKFSFADINNDLHLDGLVTFNPTQCDCGNGSMWIQFQILIVSNKNKYETIEFHDSYKATDDLIEGFFWLDSIAPNQLLGTYYQFKEGDGRCCPSIEKRIKIYFDTNEIVGIENPVPGNSLPSDSITLNNYYHLLVGKFLKIDSIKNPFLNKNISGNKMSDLSIDNNDHYSSIIRNFTKAILPIELGPKPGLPVKNLKILNDSVFITKSLGDKEYFITESGDRTERYYYGCILDSTSSYDLCLIPYINSCGFDYFLCSIQKDGELIDKISIGGFWNDISETYGIFEKGDQFNVYNNDFVFKKSGKLFLVNNMDFKYKITKTGKFKIE